MITVIVVKERNRFSGRFEEIVSHGFDDTGKTVILPCVSPESIGAVFDIERDEYIIP